VIEQVLLHTDVLGIDASVVVPLEVIGYVNTAGYGSMQGQLGLHLVNTLDVVVVTDVVDGILNGPAVFHTSIGSSWNWWLAVSANVNSSAFATLEVISDVLHAGGILQSNLICKLVYQCWITTVARSALLAIDDNLGVNTNGGWGLEVVEDVKAVSNSRGGALSPTGSAVFGNVLVLIPGQVVFAVHVSPVSDWWVFLKDVPGVGDRFFLSISELCKRNATVVLLSELEEHVFFGIWNFILASGWIVDRLWEGIDCLVICGIIFFCDSGLVPDLFSPGVEGCSPGASASLNAKIVNTSAKT